LYINKFSEFNTRPVKLLLSSKHPRKTNFFFFEKFIGANATIWQHNLFCSAVIS